MTTLLALLAVLQTAWPDVPVSRPPSPDVITVASAGAVRRIDVLGERGFPAVAIAAIGAAVTAWETTGAAVPGTAVVRLGGTSFTFVVDAAYFRSGEAVYTLAGGPYMARESLFVPLQFVTEYLPRLTDRFRWDAAQARLTELSAAGATTAAAAPRRSTAPSRSAEASAPAAGRRRVIALDPGHGGVDHGMSGPLRGRTFLREKDVTLAVSRALARELETRGFAVVMTRTRDTLIARDDRGRIAGRAGADIFVSIHVNAANPKWRNAAGARGFETYYLAEARTEDEAFVAQVENSSYRFETSGRADRGDPLAFILADLAANEHLRESSQMAELVQQSLDRVHPAVNRGVKQAPFVVLATSYMPAILIETGFGSNEAEARYLTSTSGQQRLAAAIADGIARYMVEYERRVATRP